MGSQWFGGVKWITEGVRALFYEEDTIWKP